MRPATDTENPTKKAANRLGSAALLIEVEDNGLEYPLDSQVNTHFPSEAAHNPTHLLTRWDVLSVDSQGVVLSRIGSAKTYLEALAVAAIGPSDGVVVLVPHLSQEEDSQP